MEKRPKLARTTLMVAAGGQDRRSVSPSHPNMVWRGSLATASPTTTNNSSNSSIISLTITAVTNILVQLSCFYKVLIWY